MEKYKPGSTAASTPAAAKGAPAEAAYTDTPISGMRKVIATRLLESKQQIPNYYVTVDVDMGRVSKLREVFNKSLAEKEGGAKLSVNDFVMKAAALAMKDVPDVNCAWMGDVIRQYVLEKLYRCARTDPLCLGSTRSISAWPSPLLPASSPRSSRTLEAGA